LAVSSTSTSKAGHDNSHVALLNGAFIERRSDTSTSVHRFCLSWRQAVYNSDCNFDRPGGWDGSTHIPRWFGRARRCWHVALVHRRSGRFAGATYSADLSHDAMLVKVSFIEPHYQLPPKLTLDGKPVDGAATDGEGLCWAFLATGLTPSRDYTLTLADARGRPFDDAWSKQCPARGPNLFFWTPGAMNGSTRYNHHRRIAAVCCPELGEFIPSSSSDRGLVDRKSPPSAQAHQ
jgi:hypothetical protein